jgi:outer membrane protein assembly factor BamD (BamD/ComL family)
MLADVQRALKAGRAAMALDALDRYTEQCPEGLLLEEATVSRVLALCALGRVQDARRWADEFLRRYPTSPLLPRVQATCSGASQRPAEAASANDRGRDDL